MNRLGMLSGAIRALCLKLSIIAASLLFTGAVCLAQNTQNATATNTGWVVLPISEYTLLRRAAFPADAEPALPPVEATLTRIDYDLKVDGDLASGEARLTVDVIKDGWVRVAMPEGLMVREAQLDGRQVTLVARPSETGPGRIELLLSKTGRSVLTLKIVAPVSTVAGTDILKLPVSNSAISHAEVELTRQGVDVHITGGLLLEHSETTQGSRWVANGRGNEPLTFAWRRRVDDARATQPLRLRGTITQLVGLGEDSTQVNAEIQGEVLQGLAQDITVQLPEQFTVNQVSGAMVADWNVTNRELKVTFIEPVQDKARFTVIGELRLPREGKLDIPLIRFPAAERETGGIAIEVLGAGEIKERQVNGLDEAEAADLGQLISSRQSPSLIAFRLLPAEGSSARSLSLNVARYTPQAVLTANIEEADYKAMLTVDGKVLVQSRFAVRNNQRNFLKLTLPANAVLWSASVAGRPIRPGRAPDGSLLLPLEKTRSGDESPAFVVEISIITAKDGIDIGSLAPGQIGGIIVDANGAVVPGANITVVNKQTGASLSTTSDTEGRWVVTGAQPGPTKVAVESSGFSVVQHELELAGSRPARLGTTLPAATVSETVTVQSEITSNRLLNLSPGRIDQQTRKSQQSQVNTPSQNVFNLQRRVAGILPVRVDVPRAGKSYRFVRPLVLDEETKITFQYKSKS